jgi:hypothetical protein
MFFFEYNLWVLELSVSVQVYMFEEYTVCTTVYNNSWST